MPTICFRIDGDTVRVALVPFVAQVNIGNQQSHLAWMDQAGAAPYNGELLEDRSIAHRARTTRHEQLHDQTLHAAVTAMRPVSRSPGVEAVGLIGGLLGGGSGGRNSRCYAWTPADGVNYFTLFDRDLERGLEGLRRSASGALRHHRRGARLRPIPTTMFVPFFWLDTLDRERQHSATLEHLPR